MSSSKKVYGLILPNREARPKPVVCKTSVFENDEEDSDEFQERRAKGPQTKTKPAVMKKQAQLDIEKALAADPNVFEYDKVYDEVQERKLEKSAIEKSKADKKPKFIHGLLRAAEQRKKEDERRIERTVQREREAEKGLYDDKEAFVTDAFRKKMEEMKEQEEREAMKRELEERNDVTKSANYGGFYRNLLNRKTGETEDVRIKEEKDEEMNNDKEKRHGSETDRRDRHQSTQQRDQRQRTRDSGTREEDGRRRETVRHRDEGGQRDYGMRDERGGGKTYDGAHRDSGRRSKRDECRSDVRERREARGRDSEPAKKRTRRDNSSSSESDDDAGAKIAKLTPHCKDEEGADQRGKENHAEADAVMHTGDTDDPMTDSSSSEDESERGSAAAAEDAVQATPTSSVMTSADSKSNKFAKQTVGKAFDDARARYLARKAGITVAISRDDAAS